MRTFVRQVIGAVAQLDRATTVARLRRGRRLKIEAGGHVGRPRYGWRTLGHGQLKEVELERNVLRRARQMRRQGASPSRSGAGSG